MHDKLWNRKKKHITGKINEDTESPYREQHSKEAVGMLLQQV